MENQLEIEEKSTTFFAPSFKMEFLSTVKWGKWLAIVCFVSSAIVFVMGLNMLIMGNDGVSDEGLDSAIQGISIVTAVFLWIIAGLCFVLSLILFKGCNRLLFALEHNMEEEKLISGMHKVRLFIQIATILSMISVFFSFLSTISMTIVNIIK